MLCLRGSSGREVASLILFAIASSSFLLMRDNIISAIKTSEGLATIVKLVTPRVGNDEYHYKPLKQHE